MTDGRMAVRDGHHVRPRAVDRAVQEALDERRGVRVRRTSSHSSVNSMMSSAVTSAGASERDIRKRSGWPGCRIDTWPAASNTP